jgi:hypothetical protein
MTATDPKPSLVAGVLSGRLAAIADLTLVLFDDRERPEADALGTLPEYLLYADSSHQPGAG